MIDIPFALSCLTRVNKVRISVSEREDVGSSMIRMRAFLDSAFAISTICQ
jgi:hypothetical protein